MVKADNSFRWFHSSPKVIRRVGMIYVRLQLSLRQAENLLASRGIDVSRSLVGLDSSDESSPSGSLPPPPPLLKPADSG
jgi:hypothetical protein